MFKDLSFVNPIISSTIGLLGVAFGGWIAHRNHALDLRQQLVKQKLEEFYGPLLAIRCRLKAKSELSLRISQIASEEWPKRISGVRDPDNIEKIRAAEIPAYKRGIEYDNKQLKEEILPGFKEMLSIFVAKMYLAEPSTRNHLSELIHFIETWERWIQESLAPEVLRRLDHSEAHLNPFYEDLEKQFELLQRKLVGR